MSRDLKFGRLYSNPSKKLDSLEVASLAASLADKGVMETLKSQEPPIAGYSDLKAALNAMLDTISTSDQNLLLNGITKDTSFTHQRIQTIEANLERWRTETAILEGTYVWANIPAYMLYVMEDEEVVIESRIIVGKPGNETPRFTSRIECFTVFPYWYVPRKISVREYLPAIKKDTSFLTRNNFDVLDMNGKVRDKSTIDWMILGPTNFPYTLRQREGKENSLGVLKFVFDNPYAVFVHDTNAPYLFKRKVRALSHGCIRLEKSYELAHFLIHGRSGITAESLDKYLNTEKRITISLTPSVPIHIRYFTCEVKDGKLIFYDDIYKLDRTIVAKLYSEDSF
jgi:murein L,D-transpeptidase YcbB/YkuD